MALIELRKFVLANTLNVNSIQTFTTFLYVEYHFVICFDLVDQAFGVYKSFFRGIIMLDKTKTFLFIEELYSSCDLCVHL